jgi:anti-anti-sigma factor
MRRVTITRSDVGGIAWLALDGELDMAGADEAGYQLKAVCDGAQHAVLDLRRLEFIDLAGLRLLARLGRHQRRRGARLSVIPGHLVTRLADISDMGGAIPVQAAPEELLGLADRPPGPPPPARLPAVSRTGHVLREQVAAELIRQRRLVERMQALSDAAASLLDTLRRTDRAAWEGRERRAASR